MWYLEGPQQRLGLDVAGRVCWLSSASGINRVTGSPVSVLRLTLCEQGQKRVVTPKGLPMVQAGSEQIELCWTSFTEAEGGAVSLLCRATVRVAGEGFAWSLAIESPAHVTEALFPVVGGLQGDALYVPHHAGERVLDPVRALASERYRSFVRCPAIRSDDGTFGREMTYCGQASMAWMELDGAAGGIYLGAHDPHFGLTGLRTETDGVTDLSLSLRRYGPSSPGNWETPPALLVPHDGNWRTGARIYREWISPLLPRPQHPAAAEGRTAMTPSDWLPFTQLPTLTEVLAPTGIDHLVVRGWQRDGRSAEYNPDLDLGTLSDLAGGCRQIREQGRMVSLQLDVRNLDTTSEYYPSLGSGWALKNETGQPYVRMQGDRQFASVCPDHEGWRRHVLDAARWWVSATGCQGLYLRQMGAGAPVSCYDPGHRHQSLDTYNQGYMALLDQLQAEALLLIENGGDLYASRAWASFFWTGETFDEFFALYRYTFPDHRMATAIVPRKTPDGIGEERNFFRDLERAWLLGSYLWTSPQGGFGVSDARMVAHLARATALRRAAEPYLAEARYRDTEGLVVDGAKVTRFDGPGYMALAVSNPLGVPGSVLVPEAPATVTCLELGRDAERPWSKDGRRLLLPTAGLSLLILRP